MNNHFSNRYARQVGFTIVELMVALGLSMLLMVGVIALFVSSRTSYETTERLSRIQENGRYALDQISSDAREGGFHGCARSGVVASRAEDFQINTLTAPTGVLHNFANAVQGFQADGAGGWTPAIAPITALGITPANVSDVLVLRVPRRDAIPLRVTVTQADGTSPLVAPVVAGSDIAAGDIAMISDCEARAYFSVTGYGAGVVTHAASGKNASADLLHPFKAGAEIVTMDTIIYYLAPSTADATRTSLWRRTSTSAAEELAEGIERMEVHYGEDTTNDGRVDRYVAADGVGNFGNVVSIRVAMLARATEPYGNDLDQRTYTLLERTVAPPADRFQRQIFTSTIALRNQVID